MSEANPNPHPDPAPRGGLQQAVARSSDAAELHASVQTLLLESQTGLGALAAAVTASTERGRRPFRPDAEWASRLGEVAYGLFLLADQSGVDLEDAVLLTSRHIQARGQRAQDDDDTSWPFEKR